MSFNYKTATEQELIHHIFNSPATNISVAKAYHKKVGNDDIVSRIDYARAMLKQIRMEERLNSLKLETAKHGLNIESSCPCVD